MRVSKLSAKVFVKVNYSFNVHFAWLVLKHQHTFTYSWPASCAELSPLVLSLHKNECTVYKVTLSCFIIETQF